MKSYLTFQPTSLLGPSIRHLSSFLILIICVVYFLSINKVISEKGFQLPDSLIDTALNLIQPQTNQQDTSTPQLSLPQDQLDLLKKNPQLLKQNDLLKQTVKDQVQSFLKPYLTFVPAILSVLLFLTLQSLTSILNLLIYPLLWITFYILERSGFIKFVVEQRPVKKMVV